MYLQATYISYEGESFPLSTIKLIGYIINNINESSITDTSKEYLGFQVDIFKQDSEDKLESRYFVKEYEDSVDIEEQIFTFISSMDSIFSSTEVIKE